MSKKVFKTIVLSLTTITTASLLTACSAASYASQEAFSTALLGTAAGGGVGWLIGNEVGQKAENIAVNAAIGGGVGLLAGAILNERNIKIAKKREIVVREARLISKNQRDLDRLRQEIDDSSNWGRNEVKTWDQRYQGESNEIPFQGATSYPSPSF